MKRGVLLLEMSLLLLKMLLVILVCELLLGMVHVMERGKQGHLVLLLVMVVSNPGEGCRVSEDTGSGGRER